MVIDRITGSTAGGTFAAILVGTRRATPEGSDRMEFTGEIHFGDDESVREAYHAAVALRHPRERAKLYIGNHLLGETGGFETRPYMRLRRRIRQAIDLAVLCAQVGEVGMHA